VKNHLVKAVATGFYSGYSPLVPGTVGSIPPFLIAFYLIKGDAVMTAVATIIATALSVWSAGEAEKLFGHDARKIVMDEWAGMFIAVLFVPYSLTNYFIAFVVFRILDVVKITPARQAERLPRGWGVTGDDIVAGVQTNLVTQAIIYGAAYFQLQ
jgi:phosphatidylglycerophosphatase A